MGRVVVAASHKGGTGRSVTIANVSYQLARAGMHVCMVDLDLGSSTLGSVWGLDQESDTGVVGPGVQQLLAQGSPSESQIQTALIDMWSRSRWLMESHDTNPDKGRLKLMPGNRGAGDLDDKSKRLTEPLFEILSTLSGQFDFVFADVRSGLSSVTHALTREPAFRDLVAAWLVFHRWTPQHLAGAGELVDLLCQAQSRPYLVRTAYSNPEELPPSDNRIWFMRQDAYLQEEAMRLFSSSRRIATIPFSRLLQWQERVLSPSYLNSMGFRDSQEIQAYQHLANEVKGIVNANR